MTWARGIESVPKELSKVQSWIEYTDPDLHGRNGDDGVIREWRDFKSQRKAFESFLKAAIWAIGVVAAIPGILVALSALGVIHLR